MCVYIQYERLGEVRKLDWGDGGRGRGLTNGVTVHVTQAKNFGFRSSAAPSFQALVQDIREGYWEKHWLDFRPNRKRCLHVSLQRWELKKHVKRFGHCLSRGWSLSIRFGLEFRWKVRSVLNEKSCATIRLLCCSTCNRSYVHRLHGRCGKANVVLGMALTALQEKWGRIHAWTLVMLQNDVGPNCGFVIRRLCLSLWFGQEMRDTQWF